MVTQKATEHAAGASCAEGAISPYHPRMTLRSTSADAPARGPLGDDQWPRDAYDRARTPERVLQFGTGMLLRALVDAAVDGANRAGAFGGRIVVVQSTPHDVSARLNRQRGLFTLVERGLEHNAPVERTRLIGSISRALVADAEWQAVRDVAVSPGLRVIVSNVTEAGFRLDEPEPPGSLVSFPAKLVDLLYARFTHLPDGPRVYVIPTELIPDNGPVLAGMVDRLVDRLSRPEEFRAWLAQRVRFCSSLVDRIVTGAPDAASVGELESRLGYSDALWTVAEQHALWAIEADPVELEEAFAIAGAPSVVVDPDISLYRERKLRLLNGTHTVTAPLALLAGVPTVREAVQHPLLGRFMQRVLFEEIPAGTTLDPRDATAYAGTVLERFRNPWLSHQWQVIATNQAAKFRLRVVPTIQRYVTQRQRIPRGLALGTAAFLRFSGARALDADLASLPGFSAAVDGWLGVLSREGANAALEALARPETP